jgi:hypothetical protein
MDKRITYGDMKAVMQSLEDNWGPEDGVTVILDQHVADVFQELLDDMANPERGLLDPTALDDSLAALEAIKGESK